MIDEPWKHLKCARCGEAYTSASHVCNIVACNRCDARGPGKGTLCMIGWPGRGDYRSWFEYLGMAEGWSVMGAGTKAARPLCAKCSAPTLLQSTARSLTSTELFAAHEALKSEHAKLRTRVAELEDACRVARHALRKVRGLAVAIPTGSEV